MRGSLTKGYMRLMLLGRIGYAAMENRESEIQEKSFAKEKVKEARVGKSLMELQRGETV